MAVTSHLIICIYTSFLLYQTIKPFHLLLTPLSRSFQQQSVSVVYTTKTASTTQTTYVTSSSSTQTPSIVYTTKTTSTTATEYPTPSSSPQPTGILYQPRPQVQPLLATLPLIQTQVLNRQTSFTKQERPLQNTLLPAQAQARRRQNQGGQNQGGQNQGGRSQGG